jgi:hypothetical protein
MEWKVCLKLLRLKRMTNSPESIAIVEQVKDGTTLRVRLLLSDGEHQIVNIALSGVRSARASSKQGEPSEPWGEEVGPLSPHLSVYFIQLSLIRAGQVFH